MRDRIERLVLLPFSMGCVSESSIAVGPRFPDRPKNINANSTPTRTPEDDKEGEEESEDDEESLSDDNLKSPSRLLAAPKIQKLFKNFKNLSQLFAYKDDEIEEGTGMEIGLPTDVKHVTHIGIDGSATSILSKGWGNPKSPGLPSANCPPSAFAFAMPAQADKAKVSGP